MPWRRDAGDVHEFASLRIALRAGVTISTAVASLRYTHQAGVYCPQCQRWA